ncbi:ferric-chelate reductase 1-like [Ptychodera flava]|uniref:ferric-chelate reductase 1-like n=1 Tax=Ptychodera flava TaxID=63121 RepID=UPI00396A094D
MMCNRSVYLSGLMLFCFGNMIPTLEGLDVTSDGCGDTKSCYREPADCKDKSDCDVMVTWAPEGDDATVFEILGKMRDYAGTNVEQYVGIGFSHDQRMADTDVWACILEPGDTDVKLDHSYNTDGYSNAQGQVMGIDDFEFEYSNNVIQCTFERKHKIDGEPRFFNLVDHKYHLLLPRGPRTVGPDYVKVGKHFETPFISASKYDFSKLDHPGSGAASYQGALWLSLLLAFVAVLYG